MAQSFQQVPYSPDPNRETRIFDSSREGPAETILPYGFPHKLTSDMAWKRENISMGYSAGTDTPYLLILQAPQLDEINAALRHFQRQPPFYFLSRSRLTGIYRTESANRDLGHVNVSFAALAPDPPVRIKQSAFRLWIYTYSGSSGRTVFSQRARHHLCRDFFPHRRHLRSARPSI